MTKIVRVEFWTDVHCPWCYLAKRKLDRARAAFAPGVVKVIWRSNQIDVDAPRRYPGTLADLVMRKHGKTRAEADAAHDSLAKLAAAEGLEYRFDEMKPGNSLDALRLVHWAASRELAGEMEERLLHAYFSEGVPLGDVDSLVRLAQDVGLDAHETRQVLLSDAFAADVRADKERAASFGLRGVPAFVIDDTHVLPGTQSVEALTEAIRSALEVEGHR